MLKVDRIRNDFPILADIAYMDSAATSLSPEQVVSSTNEFERHYRANVGRGVHRLTNIASQKYWHSHEKIARFIGGGNGTTVLTKNTTEAINMVACGTRWNKGDNVVTTVLEHHSNFLPWIRLRNRGVDVSVVNTDMQGSIDIEQLANAINDRTKIVAITHASNTLGNLLPVKEIAEICHEKGAKLLVDGAQSVPHIPVDVKELGCDYLCFSGHKMLGSTGTGILWMKEADIHPLMLGGGMIENVSVDGYTTADGYEKYEAGTPNISGIIGLARAVDYLEDHNMLKIREHEERLTTRILEGLREIDEVTVYGPEDDKDRIGVVSFNVDGLHPHEVAHILDEGAGIMVRSGEHCCHPLMDHLGLEGGTVRASLYLYNTEEEVDRLIDTMKELARRL
ncbi:aminotransferase class V-fold PLP-dependent enzyme [Methanolobus profundi]|uniref:cysteine desulfurase n=1 Tax=Methanolobus profundi TaxID=487685 RepID=A0A1I4USM0_9EURY|nr:cysteine desulfurase [Methanolobus profundi]SFM91974.1 cysteine desulfurase [Methanolobus profundi]